MIESTSKSLLEKPNHVAIIMDGNGRWAKAQGFKRIEGHRAGTKTAIDIVEYCGEIGIKYLTLYAFSSENWGRPHEEVLGLMGILEHYLQEDCEKLIKNEVRLLTIGDVDKLPVGVQEALKNVRARTANFSRMFLTVALSYGSRDEITRATRQIARDVLAGKLCCDDINEGLVASYLDTTGLPDPDLFIRTAGEHRLSNFLLWQLSYAELYVTDVPWPAFSRRDFDVALLDFVHRQRRYGLTSEQVDVTQYV